MAIGLEVYLFTPLVDKLMRKMITASIVSQPTST
jgi:hypothetical protein